MSAESLMLSPCLPLLVDAEQLVPWLNHPLLRIVDLAKPQVYAQVHLPAALSLSPALLVRHEEYASGLLPDLEQLQRLIQTLAITPTHSIVVYDDEGGAWAGRLIWTLHLLGFDKVSLLNGGIHAWLAKGLPTRDAATSAALLAKAASAREAVDSAAINNTSLTNASSLAEMNSHPITLQQAPDFRVTLDELRHIVAQQPDAYNLWDCRTHGEYTGSRLAARRGGHIPRAFHYEWTNAIDRQNNLILRPLPQLLATLQQHGLDPQKPLIVYCQSHHRSGLAYVVARLLNLKVRAYDGAWSEWGNRLDTPIITGENPI
ncbi:MAG: sulfurtransferase [Moraxellaceae bacterium]|nr:MAG: sulfurtransferase [Moraxellaceae bacterium]